MSPDFKSRLNRLGETPDLLTRIGRGIEKESLRIDNSGHLSQSPHPLGLGSALTHPSITTDYSEALLEFITPVSHNISDTLQQLDDVHRYVYSQIGDELLWGASMPCILEGDDSIPVAQYGSSNIARMKTVYRYGLGHRYGRLMQTISGIHYNFSMPDEFWPLAKEASNSSESLQDFITQSYFGLIRNFRRYSWLLIYLFGASPAVCKSFVRGSTEHKLESFDEQGRSLYAPYGTALRMGDLGYQSNAQKDLEVCYNTLDSYIETLREAITTSHPDYEKLGTCPNGEYKQLNTALLQIENEFYSPIRPKRVAKSGEIALGALAKGGVEYIEVRCIDVNPYLATGIDGPQIKFLDSFLLFCLLEDSPQCDDKDTAMVTANLSAVVNRGREPKLELQSANGPVELAEWGHSLLDNIGQIATLLDKAHGGDSYSQSVVTQCKKLDDPSLTPSAQILQEMKERDMPFFKLAMDYTQRWAEHFRGQPLEASLQEKFEHDAIESLATQKAMEQRDDISFEEFLSQYYQQYQHLS